MSDQTPKPLPQDCVEDSLGTGSPHQDWATTRRIVSEQNVLRLTNSGILKPVKSPVFDRVVDQARRIFDCKVSLLTIIDENKDEQFFKAGSGLPTALDEARRTSLAYSFCKIVVQNSAPLVISDARIDPRVTGHEAVAKFGVVAYLGVPVKDETGQAIAALCLVEPEPRVWTSANIEVLQAFAEGVSTQVKTMFWAEQGQTQNVTTTKDVPFRIGKLAGAMLAYYHGPDGTEWIEAASAETRDIWGISSHVYVETYSDVFAMCLAEDYPLARASFGNSAAGMIPWHHKWRIRTPQGEVRWLEGHGLPVSSPEGGILWKCIVSDMTPVVP